jgi:carboxyl-terminal processing protease
MNLLSKMKRTALLFLCSQCIVTLVFSQNDLQDKMWDVSDGEKVMGLMTIWSEAKFGFPYPDKLEALHWDRTVEAFIPRVIEAKSIDAYYKILMEFASLLEDSHTYVLPPWGYFKPDYDMPPFEIVVINDRFYISRTGDADDLKQNNIVPGIEILECEDMLIGEYFKANVLRYYSWGSKHANEATLVFYLFYGPKEKNVELKIRDSSGITRDVALQRNSLCNDGSPFMYEFITNMMASNIVTKWLNGNILYVQIPTLENDEVANQFQSMIDTLDVDHLRGMILDLRNNSGGKSQNSNKVVACLIDQPVSSPLMHFPHYIAAYKAWGKEDIWGVEKNTISPRDGKRYSGPLTVLVNAITSSSAEDIAIELIAANRTKIIGQPSEGGAGNTYVFDLPGGGSFRMATFKATYPDGTEYIGIGIQPDEIIPLSIDDIVSRKDRAIDRSLELLNQ